MSVHIGEILIEKGVLARDDLDRAVELQKERGDKLGKILMDLGFVAPREVLLALSEQLETPLVTVQDFPSVLPDIDAITVRYMRQFRFLPLELNGDVLTLAMVDPLDFETLASVRSVTGFEVRAVLSSEQEILDAIDKHYGEEEAEQESHEYGVGGNDSAEIEHLRDVDVIQTHDELGFVDQHVLSLIHI